jgi:hypothetical protein
MLIIATDWFVLYRNFTTILRSYLPFCKSIEYYFIQYKPDTDPIWVNNVNNHKFVDDFLYLKGNESFIPGILDKTIHAMRLFNLDNYDFFIRTNLSSFFILDKFISFLESLPRKELYCSPALSWSLTEDGKQYYGSGCLIILSMDCAKFLCRDNCILNGRCETYDDIVIGRELWYIGGYKIMDIVHRRDIFDIITTDTNKLQTVIDDIDNDVVYIKVRNENANTTSTDNRLIIDTGIMRLLVKRYYGMDIKQHLQLQ